MHNLNSSFSLVFCLIKTARAVHFKIAAGRISNKWRTVKDDACNGRGLNLSKNRYRGADKSLARSTSRFILFMVRIFRLMLVLLYIYITNIYPIMIINRMYEKQNLLSLSLVSFLVGLGTYQHPYVFPL
jgi:hypothetical protein